MFAFVLLFLVAIVIAAIAVWLWRLLSSQYGEIRNLMVNPETKTRLRLKPQRGFMSVASSSRQNTNHKTLGHSKAGNKAPWGW